MDFSDKAPKLTYFTPRFNGFQFAASWTPDTQANLGSSPFGASDSGSLRFGTANEENTYTNAIDIAAHYSGEIEGFGITAQAGFGTVDAPDNLKKFKGLAKDEGLREAFEAHGLNVGDLNDDPKIIQTGLAVSWQGLTIAGGWAKVEDGQYLQGGDGDGNITIASLVDNDKETGLQTLQNTEGHSWTIGAGYTTGPWAFSAGYLHGREKGNIWTGGSDKNDFFQVSTSYALSPGLSVNLQYARIERETDTKCKEISIDGYGKHDICGKDSDTDAVMLGVKVGF